MYCCRFVFNAYNALQPQGKFDMMPDFVKLIEITDKSDHAQQGIKVVKDLGIQFKKYCIAPYVNGFLTAIKTQRANLQDDVSAKAADDAIKAINNAD